MSDNEIKVEICDICNNVLKDISFVDLNNYFLCDCCKEEARFLQNWREERYYAKRKAEKITAGMGIVSHKKVINDVIPNILKFI